MLFIFSIAAVLASFRGTCVAQKAAAPLNKGISCVFLKTSELMTKPNWRSTPLGVQKAREKIGRYDAFWCAQIMAQYNRPAWQFLRRNTPDQIMLFYVSSSSTRRTPDQDVITYFDYDYINTHHPEWFLLKDSRDVTLEDCRDEAKRIRWATSDPSATDYNRFYIDVANKDFQKWAASQILDFVSGKKKGLVYAYDGLAMDNVYVGKRLHERFKRKYPHWKYAHNFKAWSEGFGEYLKTVKRALNQHGFILIGNHNPAYRDRSGSQEVWDILYESVDGILTEQALRQGWLDSSYFADDEWLAAMARHEEILDKGLINWWVCCPTASGRRTHDVFLYTYCSWLLIKKPGKSFYSAVDGSVANKRTVLWYDEYDLPIGESVSGRYLKNNCWFRDYTNARIVVNPTDASQKVVVDRNKLWLEWTSKKLLTKLELPPQSGRILLPTTYNVEEPIE